MFRKTHDKAGRKKRDRRKDRVIKNCERGKRRSRRFLYGRFYVQPEIGRLEGRGGRGRRTKTEVRKTTQPAMEREQENPNTSIVMDSKLTGIV